MTKFLFMEHARPTVTVFVILLSFIALEGFLTVARRGIAVHDHSTFVLKAVEELLAKTGNKKLHRGRVMAMAEEASEERSTMKAGADPSVRKCGHGEDDKSSLGCELRHKIHPSKLHFSGRIPFTSDYRDAKTSLSESLRLSNTKVSISKSTPKLQKTGSKASVKQSKFQEATEASSSHAFLRSWRKLQPSGFSRPHEFFQTNPDKHLLADKFYKMVNNDYNLRARRHPPVHN